MYSFQKSRIILLAWGAGEFNNKSVAYVSLRHASSLHESFNCVHLYGFNSRLSQILTNLDGKEDLCLVDEVLGKKKYYGFIRHLIQTVWKIQWCVCDVDHTNRDVGKWRKSSGICKRQTSHTAEISSSTERRFCNSLLLIWGNALERNIVE